MWLKIRKRVIFLFDGSGDRKSITVTTNFDFFLQKYLIHQYERKFGANNLINFRELIYMFNQFLNNKK